MSVRIACPGCGREANVEELSLGRRGRCKQCGHVFALVLPGGGSGSGSSQASPASAWKGEPSPGPASAPDLPEQFGRYRVMRRLAMGGMGAVYLAQDVRLGRSVALKVPFFHPTEGAGAIARFEREARAAATLDHPNLCPVYDVGDVDGIHYLTMPFLEGKPLSEVMPRGQTIPEAQAAIVVRKLALALAEAHAKGVIHRDLKPGNIMVNRRRELVIMDFGLARLAGSDAPLTVSGHVLGTALYMAPEQAAGHVEATGPPCDVYSLGVILYELLTGVRPFEGPWAVVIGLKSVRDPDPPSVHRPGLDPRLDAICRRAIARDPADRFQTMTEFAAAMEPIIARAPVPVEASASADEDASNPDLDSAFSQAVQMFADLKTGDDENPLRASKRPRQPQVSPIPNRLNSGRRSPARVVGALGGTAFLILLSLIVIHPIGGRNVVVGIDPSKKSQDAKKSPVVVVEPKIDPAGQAEVVRGFADQWVIEGRELILNGGSSENWLLFGDPNWTDYDFEFAAIHEQEVSGLTLLFRSPDPLRILRFGYGWNNYRTAFLRNEAEQDLRTLALKRDEPPIENHREYRLKVVVRGRTTSAYCDGRLVFTLDNNPFDRGRVGFGARYNQTGQLRIKEIRVRAPDGSVLWDGPPRSIGDATKVGIASTVPLSRPEIHLNRGQWRREGNELVQTSLGLGKDGAPCLVFGDDRWADYDLTIQAQKIGGSEGVIVNFHWKSPETHCHFGLGTFGNTRADLITAIDYRRTRFMDDRSKWVESGRWYTLDLKVRGAMVRCYLDGKLCFASNDTELNHGQIALATWATSARFRKLRVTRPDGTPLIEDLPDLPAQ